jgi:hypothetical protein
VYAEAKSGALCKTVGSADRWFEPNTRHHPKERPLTSKHAVRGRSLRISADTAGKAARQLRDEELIPSAKGEMARTVLADAAS